MHCDYFSAGTCRSCSMMNQPYLEQLAGKEQHLRAQLAGYKGLLWLPAVGSAESGFRNKAKMVVSGQPGNITLGILDTDGHGLDLRSCGLCSPGLLVALEALAAIIDHHRFTPYDVPARRGELKYLLVTESPTGELMVRFVLRSRAELHLVKRALEEIQAQLPAVVVSVNLHPEHKASLEGEEEIILTEQQTLPMQVGGVTLHLRTRSFFQTNTEIASALYAQGAAWVRRVNPSSLWDLYCGVGGFALTTAAAQAHDADTAPQPRITGIEISTEAITSAQQSAAEAGLSHVSFASGDATAFVRETSDYPEMVIVNPPRRGLGAELATALNESPVPWIIYSSCNAVTLAKDLAVMGNYSPVEARLMDMFPQTTHYEAMVLLQRR